MKRYRKPLAYRCVRYLYHVLRTAYTVHCSMYIVQCTVYRNNRVSEDHGEEIDYVSRGFIYKALPCVQLRDLRGQFATADRLIIAIMQ